MPLLVRPSVVTQTGSPPKAKKPSHYGDRDDVKSRAGSRRTPSRRDASEPSALRYRSSPGSRTSSRSSVTGSDNGSDNETDATDSTQDDFHQHEHEEHHHHHHHHHHRRGEELDDDDEEDDDDDDDDVRVIDILPDKEVLRERINNRRRDPSRSRGRSPRRVQDPRHDRPRAHRDGAAYEEAIADGDRGGREPRRQPSAGDRSPSRHSEGRRSHRHHSSHHHEQYQQRHHRHHDDAHEYYPRRSPQNVVKIEDGRKTRSPSKKRSVPVNCAAPSLSSSPLMAAGAETRVCVYRSSKKYYESEHPVVYLDRSSFRRPTAVLAGSHVTSSQSLSSSKRSSRLGSFFGVAAQPHTPDRPPKL